MHPGIGSYTSGSSMNNRQYFYKILRKFKAEKGNFQGLIQDLTRSPFELPQRKHLAVIEKDEHAQDLAEWERRLSRKFNVRRK